MTLTGLLTVTQSQRHDGGRQNLRGTVENPEFTVVDIQVGLTSNNWELMLNLDNAFDERYYTDVEPPRLRRSIGTEPAEIIIGTHGHPRLFTVVPPIDSDTVAVYTTSAGELPDALELAKRALQHFNEGSTDRAPSQMRIPLSAYTDESRFQAERDAVFHSPIAVALSLSSRPDFQTQTIMGAARRLATGTNGTLFSVNVCRHRGAKVCQQEKGHQARFSCPYHAWTYNNRGELVGVYGEESWRGGPRNNGTDGACLRGASGGHFVCLTWQSSDIDAWL